MEGFGPQSGAPRSVRDSARSEVRHRPGDVVRGRYSLLEELGKGGAAVVYRATDSATRRDVALKQLLVGPSDRHYRATVSLFDREFQTLAQLSHPSIIEVYDFGIDDAGAYYTMELLDGGDLRERAPLDWVAASAVAYDICSSLALLHSRRFVHRDVSPRNIRCTHSGRAKLIDFGAMAPMGAGGLIVGTPQFVAPEVVHRANLDARTDLFSLGATLYFALSGRLPYPASQLAHVMVAWKTKPPPPSAYATGIPEALDHLVLELVGIDPATRPRTAFEVMHRLAAIAALDGAEPPQVPRAYLSTPVMVGRDDTLERLGDELRRAIGGAGRSVVLTSAPGAGRTRILDAAALLAQTLGGSVLRASGSVVAEGAFGTAERLAEQLLEDLPAAAVQAAVAEGVENVLLEADAGAETSEAPMLRLRSIRAPGTARYQLQTALARWILRVSETHPLIVAVDDVHRVDEPSAALLAALATNAGSRRLFVVVTAESGADPVDRLAFDVLCAHASTVSLEPLSRSDCERLLESVLGDVANIGTVSDGIFALAEGNPRATMDLVEHLVNRGVLRYERGIWTLPTRLDVADLPRDAEAALHDRIAALPPLARWLVETQTLASHKAFTRDDYAKLRPDMNAAALDAAITELVSHRIVTSDGRTYSPSRSAWSTLLGEALPTPEQAARHRALVTVYEGKLPLGVVRHALLGGLEVRALDELAPILPGLPEATNLHELTDLGAMDVAATFERALTAAERVGRSPLEANHLRRWLASLSVSSDDRYYFRVAKDWLAQLKHDSGYTLWEERVDIADPGERLSSAMQTAFERHGATPEAERIYRPDEAIRGLAHFVGISMAIGSSRLELSITESLPALLEPFAPIAPLVAIIWQNALAARDSSCRSQWERGRARWLGVYERLATVDGADPKLLGVFRRAVAYAIGANEASMGIATATRWADLLDDDPVQRVNALYIRRIIHLQQGDAEGAERLRKEAEVVTLQARGRQMFAHLHWVELVACGMARDVTGVKQCGDRIRALAKRSSGWAPYVDLAEGYFRLCCDDLEPARAAFERAMLATAPRPEAPYPRASAWCLAAAGYVEALSGLGRNDDARREGASVLAMCDALDIGAASYGISRAVAVAEAKSGHVNDAVTRLDRVLCEQTELGVAGLQLGATHEARARVAIAAGDARAFDEHAALAAREYRHGRGSPLGARFERLVADGLSLGRPEDLGARHAADSPHERAFASSASATSLRDAMRNAGGPDQRAERALEWLCTTTRAVTGHFYLLLGDGSVRRTASFGAAAPPAGLGEFVSDFAQGALADEGATEVMSDDVTVADKDVFIAADGARYHLVLLSSGARGELRHAGLVALELDDGCVVNHEISLAIGSILIQAGDTVGITA